MPKQTFEWIHPDKLRNHPLNIKIYADEKPDADLVASVKEHGVLIPIHVVNGNTIISGHRRKNAARVAGLGEVPIIRHLELSDELDIEEFLIRSNEQREKTMEQKAREYEQLKSIEARRAEKRKKSGKSARNTGKTDLAQNSAQGRAPESRKVAAEALGMSHDTAEKASKVVKAIDAAEQSGDADKATHLRETLNKSVSAAHKEVSPKRQPKAETVAKQSATLATRQAIFKPWEKALGQIAKEALKLNREEKSELYTVFDMALTVAMNALVAWKTKKSDDAKNVARSQQEAVRQWS